MHHHPLFIFFNAFSPYICYVQYRISLNLFLGVVEEYQPPFFDCLHQDPSFEDVRYVVSIQKRRPDIPNRWIKDPVCCLC